MKRKLKIMNHQIDQLKEEITTKEAALVKVNLDHTRVEKEKEALKVLLPYSVMDRKYLKQFGLCTLHEQLALLNVIFLLTLS